MHSRLMSNLNTVPGHGSIWIFAFNNFPENWAYIRTSFIIIISLLWSYTFIIKKLNIAAISLFLLVLFVDIMLLQGSLDRMNIGIIVSTVLFCFIDLKYSRILAWYTIIVGWCLYLRLVVTGSVIETVDVLFIIGYIIVFSLYPLYCLFIIKNINVRSKN
jgi:hypothetical protein